MPLHFHYIESYIRQG